MVTTEQFVSATASDLPESEIGRLANPTRMALTADELAEKRQAVLSKWRWHPTHRAVHLFGGKVHDSYGNVVPLGEDGQLVEVGLLYQTEHGPLKLGGAGPGEDSTQRWFCEPATGRAILHYPPSAHWPVRRAD